MQTAKQLSVALVNKPGRLAALLAALNKGKVNLQALVVMDSSDRGKVRFVPDDYAAAAKVLDDSNLRYDSADVLLVPIPPQPGAFRKICERLATEHLNIDYAYCSFSGEHRAKGGALAVIRVNDLAKAQRVLGVNGSAAARTARRNVSVRRPVFTR